MKHTFCNIQKEKKTKAILEIWLMNLSCMPNVYFSAKSQYYFKTQIQIKLCLEVYQLLWSCISTLSYTSITFKLQIHQNSPSQKEKTFCKYLLLL